MKSLSAPQPAQLISLLENGKSTRQIASVMGIHYSTISKFQSKHLPDLKMAKDGRPLKLTPADVRHATRLVLTGKAENAVQVTHVLGNIKFASLSVSSYDLGITDTIASSEWCTDHWRSFSACQEVSDVENC